MGRAHLGSLMHLPKKDVRERAAAPLRMRKEDLSKMAFPSDSTPAIHLLFYTLFTLCRFGNSENHASCAATWLYSLTMLVH
jgi:hypothetical protein